MGLVISGMLAAAGHTPPAGASRRQIVLGAVWGVLAMLTLALGIVIAKPVLEHTPVIWATTVRQLGCLGALLPIALVSRNRRDHLAVIRPNRDWRFMLPGAVLGSYLSLIFWIAGIKYAPVGVAAILNQSSTIYVLLLAAVFLREPFTRRKAAASLVALAGILLVTIG
jgi:drug/metabolite transporter (DMT)-like permease